MLVSKAARGCMSSFTDTHPSPEQIKRNIDVMKKAADEVVVSENRGIRGGQKQIECKKKRKSAWRKEEDSLLLAFLKSHPDDFKAAAVELGRRVKSCKIRYNTLMLSHSEDGLAGNVVFSDVLRS